MPNHSRQSSGSLSSRIAGLGRKKLSIIGATAVVVIGLGVGLGIGLGGSSKPAAKHHAAPPPTTEPALSNNLCPLTGLPAPGGTDPVRPAIAIKIGNEPDGPRPQAGLNEADIVFDTPAEGFIMRYIAVYQCQDPSGLVGPNRSVRWVDFKLVRQLIHPILAYAGGINPNVDNAESSKWLESADLLENASSATERTTNRVAPDNLYTNLSDLWKMFPNEPSPPPIFTYSQSLPSGEKPATSLGINFSGGTDVLWKWDASLDQWVHTYSGAVDIDTLTNKPVTTTNIVVEVVHYKIGPYIESTGGTGDVESQTLGSGVGYVFRNGTYVKVTWHRSELVDPTVYTGPNGKAVSLAPGRTWVEIVPDTVYDASGSFTITP